jgi:hypothetical protein
VPDTNFTSAALVKGRLGISVATDDTQIELLIDGIVAKFKEFTGRGLYTAAYTEVLDGRNTSEITVKNPPITAITSVTVGGEAYSVAATSTAAGYQFSDQQVYLLNVVRGFRRGKRNVTIVYTGGYTTIPQDLKEAALQQACFEYKRRRHEGENSMNLGNGEQLVYEPADFLPAVKTVLMRHMRMGQA